MRRRIAMTQLMDCCGGGGRDNDSTSPFDY